MRNVSEEALSGPVAMREEQQSRCMHIFHLGNRADGGVIPEQSDPERTVAGWGVGEKWVWVPFETSLAVKVPGGQLSREDRWEA